MNGIGNIYSPAIWILDAFACALRDQGIPNVFTRRSANQDFQKVRPRTELKFTVGPAKQSYGPAALVVNSVTHDFSGYNASYSGMMEAECCCNLVEGSDVNPALDAYESAVRYAMQKLRPTFNFSGINGARDSSLSPLTFGSGSNAHVINGGDKYLIYHKVQNIIDHGTTPVIRPEEGYEKSSIMFAIDFGVDAAAWAELVTNT